jgi:hypothetical protein
MNIILKCAGVVIATTTGLTVYVTLAGRVRAARLLLALGTPIAALGSPILAPARP